MAAMQLLRVPAIKQHTSTVILAHGLGDRYDLHDAYAAGVVTDAQAIAEMAGRDHDLDLLSYLLTRAGHF